MTTEEKLYRAVCLVGLIYAVRDRSDRLVCCECRQPIRSHLRECEVGKVLGFHEPIKEVNQNEVIPSSDSVFHNRMLAQG